VYFVHIYISYNSVPCVNYAHQHTQRRTMSMTINACDVMNVANVSEQ